MGARAVGLRESVYVAASSREATRAANVALGLVQGGYRIAYPWWLGPILPSDDELPRYARASLCELCMHAAQSADRFVLLVPPSGVATVGVWVELGAALAVHGVGDNVGDWLHVAGPRPPTLFLHGALWFESDRELVSALIDGGGDVVVRAGKVL